MNSTDRKLESIREQIDVLDEKIVKFLNDRAKLSINIAQIKSQNKMPVLSQKRENILLEKIIAKNTGPFDSDAIHNIFNSIMNESKRLQNLIVDKDDNNR